MNPLPGCSIGAHSADLSDPRMARARRHDPRDAITVAPCGLTCGADSWVEGECFGRVFAALDHRRLAHRLVTQSGLAGPTGETHGVEPDPSDALISQCYPAAKQAGPACFAAG